LQWPDANVNSVEYYRRQNRDRKHEIARRMAMADEFCYRSSHKNKCIFGQDFDKRKLLVLYAQSAHVCPAIRIALSSAGATSLAGM